LRPLNHKVHDISGNIETKKENAMIIKRWLSTIGFTTVCLILLLAAPAPAAADYLNSAITDTNTADYWLDQGGLFATYGSYSAAVEAYKKALALDANNSKACYDMAVAYGELGELDQALVEINRAIALDDSRSQYYYGRAWILLKVGRMTEANDNFQKAADMGDLDAIAYLQER
jgi:tetratricopeptide (TPR) repeat protein